MTDRVPIERLRPILNTWLEQHRRRFPADQGRDSKGEGNWSYEPERFVSPYLKPFSAMDALAQDVGVSKRRLQIILHGGTEYDHRLANGEWRKYPVTAVSFKTADRIITAIDPSLWHTELADLYEQAA